MSRPTVGLALVVVLSSCGRVAFDASDSVDGLVVGYPFDEVDGVIVRASVDGYEAACDTCPSIVAGVRGTAYEFDGSQSFELPPIASSLVGAEPYTVSLWVRTGVPTKSNVFVAKPFNALDTNVFSIAFRPSPEITFETTQDGVNYDYTSVMPVTDVVDEQWHHLAASWDGGTKRVWVDGELRAIVQTVLLDSSDPLVVGADCDNNARLNFYRGGLDDLRFYGRALTEAEIQLLATP